MKTKLFLLAFVFSGFIASAQSVAILNLRVFLEGYYQGSCTMSTPYFDCAGLGSSNSTDEITVYLYNTNCQLVDAGTTVLASDGWAQVPFTVPSLTAGYWIRVTHLGHIDVWSAAPVNYTTNPRTYNFTTASSQAYCGNQANVGTCSSIPAWGMYAGDVNGDCSVDGSDFLLIDAEIQNGSGGYTIYDLNGDCSVDGSDWLVMEANLQNGVGCCSPCESWRKASPGSSLKNFELSVSPNPASDYVTVTTNLDKCDLTIMNAIGEVVHTERMDYMTSIPVSNLPKGLYYLTIVRDGKVEGNRKIAIQ